MRVIRIWLTSISLLITITACSQSSIVPISRGRKIIDPAAPLIPAALGRFLPAANTYYSLAPGELYKITVNNNPRPQSLFLAEASDMSNEFVYRTELRQLVTLPAATADSTAHGYTMTYNFRGGGGEMKIFVPPKCGAVKVLGVVYKRTYYEKSP